MERLTVLLDTMITADPLLGELHARKLQELIDIASVTYNPKGALLLPHIILNCIPPRGSVPAEVIVEASLDEVAKEDAIHECQRLLGAERVANCHLSYSAEVPAITILANNLKKLARKGVRAVSIGVYGIDELCRKNKKEFNKIYSRDGYETAPGFKSESDFRTKKGGEPYYAPIGWRRWSIDLGLSSTEFDDAYGEWPVAYHGTLSSNILLIVEKGFRSSAGEHQCFLKDIGFCYQ